MSKIDTEREWYIYVLKDPRNGEIRYVGWTTNIKHRLRQHVHDARAGRMRTHKANWIRQLLSLDMRPIIEVIDRGVGEWQSVEQYWIMHYRMQGIRLTNLTDGGEGTIGKQWTDEQRMNMSAAQKGRTLSAEHRRNISLGGMGRRWSTEQYAKMKGRKHTPESRKKMSDALRGRPRNPETVEKQRAKIIGRKASSDEIEKSVRSRTGLKRSDTARQNMSAAQKLRGQTKEHMEMLRQKNIGLPAHNRTKVMSLEDGIIYDSLLHAAQSVGVTSAAICVAIKSGRCSAGLHWTKVEGRSQRPTKPVICIETGEIFASSSDAAAAKGMHSRTIERSARMHIRCGGYHWEYVDQD